MLRKNAAFIFIIILIISSFTPFFQANQNVFAEENILQDASGDSIQSNGVDFDDEGYRFPTVKGYSVSVASNSGENLRLMATPSSISKNK